MIVGTKAGDVYDLYPRLLAEVMPKYIPGNPNIIIQNMPGAASLIAANQVYNVAKPDGLTLAAIYPSLYFDQLVQKPEAKFDWNKFGWIGSPVGSNHMMYMRTDTPYKTIEDVRAADAPAEMRHQRGHLHRVLHSQAARGSGRRQIRDRHRLPGGSGRRSRRRAR